MRFQQITGPVTAKGVEDTALYRYNRLVSLNEVGGDPSRFGTPVAEFHAANAAGAARGPRPLRDLHPRHQAQRGRARPDQRAVRDPGRVAPEGRRLAAAEPPHRTTVDGPPTPGANEEYLIYQTLSGPGPSTPSGSAPTFSRRSARPRCHELDQPQRALRRRRHALRRGDPRSGALARVPRRLRAIPGPVAHFGALNSLAQTLVKITAPGVPDFYQGTRALGPQPGRSRKSASCSVATTADTCSRS